NERDFGTGVEGRDGRLEVPRMQQIIIVKHDEVWAGAHAQRPVEIPDHADVGLETVGTDSGILDRGNEAGRVVGGSVVCDQQLEVRERLREHAFDRFAKQRRSVERENHDRAPRSALVSRHPATVQICVLPRIARSRVKILFLSHQYPPETNWGGIGSYTATMSRALSERGHEVHVLTCWDGQQSIDRMEGDVVVHRRQNVRIPGLRRFLRLPGVRAAARPLRTPEAQSSANPSLRLKTAITCYREHSRLAVDFDVVEAPDWMAEGLVFGLRHPIPLVVDLK